MLAQVTLPEGAGMMIPAGGTILHSLVLHGVQPRTVKTSDARHRHLPSTARRPGALLRGRKGQYCPKRLRKASSHRNRRVGKGT